MTAAIGGFARLTAWIICRDQRLGRLLESELIYLGITAVMHAAPPTPSQAVSLLLWDGDEFPGATGIALAENCGCPLLVFGRDSADLPSAEGRTFLRRPFALTELEKTVQALLANAPSPVAMAIAPSPPSVEAPTTPPLTLQDGTVTVGQHTVNLTPAEQVILEYLYAHRGETVSRAELSTLLGGGGNSVDVYVCHLRTKIEKPLGRRMIWTVRGVGYRMDDPQI